MCASSELTQNLEPQEEPETPPKSRRRSQPEKWKKNILKLARYAPKSRPQYPTCGHNSNALRCCTLSLKDIEAFHCAFYSTRVKAEQDAFLLRYSCLEPVKRHRGRDFSRKPKLNTSKCFVKKLEGEMVPVCQKSFIRMLGISKRRLVYCLYRYYKTGEMPRENRGGKRPRKKKNSVTKDCNVSTDISDKEVLDMQENAIV